MKIILSSKIHHYVKRLSIFLIMAVLIVGMVGCGDTTPTVEIQDWYDLDAIRENLGGSYLLMNDLDSTTAGYEDLASTTASGGNGWEPIETSYNPFTGILDGQGYEIRDLSIDRPQRNYVGLFGYVDEGGTIEDIGATNVDVTGYHYVGGLVGSNQGTVTDSYSIGSVMGEEYVGGLVGYREGYVSFSFWDTATSGQDTSDGGTGKTTAEMQDIDTFTDTETQGLYEPWDMIAVANPGTRNSNYIWNIVDDETYPFLSWQS